MAQELDQSLETPITQPQRTPVGLKRHYKQIRMDAPHKGPVDVRLLMSGVEIFDNGEEEAIPPAELRDRYGIDPNVRAQIDADDDDQMSEIFVVNDPVLGAIQISLGGIYAAVKGYAIKATKDQENAVEALDVETD